MEIKVGDTLKWKEYKEVHTITDIDEPKEKGIRWVTLLRGDVALINKWSANYHYIKTLLDECSISINGVFIIQKKLETHNFNE